MFKIHEHTHARTHARTHKIEFYLYYFTPKKKKELHNILTKSLIYTIIFNSVFVFSDAVVVAVSVYHQP
jgi:hypothetical protein